MGDRELTPEEIAREKALKAVTPAAVEAYNNAAGTAALDNAVAAAQGAATNTEVTPVGNVGGSAGDVDTAEKESTMVATKGDAADGTSVGSVKTGDASTGTTTDVTTDADKKEDSLANFMSQYIDDLGYTEEQKKADERRKRAAQWVTAAQMLGDSLGALGNVINVGHGAVSQTIEPGALKAGAATYQLDQDIRAAQEKARKAQYDAILKKYEMEWEKEKADRAQANADRAHDLQKESLEETKRHNKVNEGISQQGADTSAINAGTAATRARNEETRLNETYNKKTKIPVGGKTVEVDEELWNNAYPSLYNMLPDEVRLQVETKVKEQGYDTSQERAMAKATAMRNAVLANINNPMIAAEVARLAGDEKLAQQILSKANEKLAQQILSKANANPSTSDGTYVSAPVDATRNAGSMGGYGSAADWASGVMDNVRKMSSGKGKVTKKKVW